MHQPDTHPLKDECQIMHHALMHIRIGGHFMLPTGCGVRFLIRRDLGNPFSKCFTL